ncbi:hypothetical protein [Bacillus mycoides]|uniref:hypothetical protein n=1 Tax=Bacillus mycoides TaxID=1405 RepID=UPI001C009CB4|nr:hypothetical protein [Bacillus mycoides]
MRLLGTFIMGLAFFGQIFAYKTETPVLMLTLICCCGIGIIAYEDGKRAARKS